MLTRRHALGAALAASSLALAGTAHAQSWKSAYPELVLAVIPAENASGVTERYGPFVEYLSQTLGTKVTLRVANDYAAVIEGQRNGSIHLAGYGPASYARAIVTGVKVEPFVTTVNNDGTVGYYSVFYVRADSPYKTIDDLKGKNLGCARPSRRTRSRLTRSISVPCSPGSKGTVLMPASLSTTTTSRSAWTMRLSAESRFGRGAASLSSTRCPAETVAPMSVTTRPSRRTFPVSIARRTRDQAHPGQASRTARSSRCPSATAATTKSASVSSAEVTGRSAALRAWPTGSHARAARQKDKSAKMRRARAPAQARERRSHR